MSRTGGRKRAMEAQGDFSPPIPRGTARCPGGGAGLPRSSCAAARTEEAQGDFTAPIPRGKDTREEAQGSPDPPCGGPRTGGGAGRAEAAQGEAPTLRAEAHHRTLAFGWEDWQLLASALWCRALPQQKR